MSAPLLRLSQGQLNLLTTCPRKFQHTYLEQLTHLNDPKQEEHQILGSRFHLLMQQQEMGLPIHSFLQTDAQLQRWMSAFTKAAPDILTPIIDQPTFRESEHYRTWQIQDCLFTVIYDLFIADQEQAQIIDWKTYPRPQNSQNLANNWQTKLYMYILAETSQYLPENISMTYWFIQSPDHPERIKFSYDHIQHQKIAQELSVLLSNLATWLLEYQQNQPFPQTPTHKNCLNCQFAVECEREQTQEMEMMTTSLANMDNIPEVSL
jgi:hypothetical protein